MPSKKKKTPLLVDAEQIETAKLRLSISRRAMLWVDGVKMGKTKRKKLELEAGEHTIRAIMGRKMMVKSFSVDDGDVYKLKLDFRRKKADLKRVR